mgnify:CR=1 FL=1
MSSSEKLCRDTENFGFNSGTHKIFLVTQTECKMNLGQPVRWWELRQGESDVPCHGSSILITVENWLHIFIIYSSFFFIMWFFISLFFFPGEAGGTKRWRVMYTFQIFQYLTKTSKRKSLENGNCDYFVIISIHQHLSFATLIPWAFGHILFVHPY